MKTWTCVLLIAAVCAWPAAADHLLAKVTLEQLQAASMPNGVQIEARIVDGEAWATITNNAHDPVSIQLAVIPVAKLENTRVVYEAEVACENVTGQAYLELWAVVLGNAYFSRALHDPFTGTQPARHTSTPFYLKRDEPLESARLGIRFEGPGTVSVGRMALWNRSHHSPGHDYDTFGRVLGAVVGILSGIWGCTIACLVPKGRARSAVLGVTGALAAAGLITLLGGGGAWALGSSPELAHALVLTGAVLSIVYGTAYVSLRARYRQSEERRMHAMDLE